MPQFNRSFAHSLTASFIRRATRAGDHRTVGATLVAAMACVMVLVARPLPAQHTPVQATSPFVAPKEGSQFSFLVGQWEVVAKPIAKTLGQKIHGVQKLQGVWKAWRALDGWGIEDELRLTDASGNPRLLAHTIRFFDSGARKWSLSAIDVYKGVVSTSVAELRGNEIVASGQGKEADGIAYLSRGTFTKMTPQSFTYRFDRSYDNGKTWTEGVTTIEAKRVAATAPR